MKRIFVLTDILLAKFRKKPAILAIGDSWFNLFVFNWKGIFRVDILDWLRKHKLNIVDTAFPSYTLRDEIENTFYKTPVELIAKFQKKLLVLLSIGGNDLIVETLGNVFEGNGSSTEINVINAKKYIKEFTRALNIYLDFVKEDYISHGGEDIKFMIHGYCYARWGVLTFGKWEGFQITPIFKEIQLTNKKHADRLIKIFVNLWNDELKELSKNRNDLIFVDLRGQLKQEDWIEELHPTPKGFAKLASIINSKIKKLDKRFHEIK